jgi:hypothetical protein
VVVTQLREVPAAERSGEAAQEHEDDGAVRQQVVERNVLAVRVGQYEPGCRVPYGGAGAVNGHRLESTDGRNRGFDGVDSSFRYINQGVRGFDFDVRDG